MTQFILSDRSNADRKAKLMIIKGEAPSMQYSIAKRGEREFEIVWGANGEVPDDTESTDSRSAPLDEVGSDSFAGDMDHQVSAEANSPAAAYLKTKADRKLARAEKGAKTRAERQVKAEARKARIQASVAHAVATETFSKPAKQPTKRGPRGKYNAASADGELPPKPVITSPTNQAYQTHIDMLTALAKDGKWDEVAEYPVKKDAKQTYAKVLSRYHDRLMAARPL